MIKRTELTAVVCDDEPSKRHAVTELLDRAGCTLVVETSSLARMREIVLEARPDVIVFDLALAGLGGLDVIRDLHAICPSCAVVVLTPFTSLREDALAAGARALVDTDDLRELIPALAGLHTPRPRHEADARAMETGTPAPF